MDGSNAMSGYGFLQQPQQQAAFGNQQPNMMMQPNMGMNTLQPGLNPMAGMQSTFSQAGMGTPAFPQAGIAMSGYNATFTNTMGQQQLVPQVMNQSNMVNPAAAQAQPGMSFGGMPAAQPAAAAPSYQQPNMMAPTSITPNPSFAPSGVTPPWRASEQVEEDLTAANDSLQLKGTSVFIAGLPQSGAKKKLSMDEETVRSFFSSNCGRVKSLRWQAARGYCFITFATADAAAKAVALSGTDVNMDPSADSPTRLVVKYAQDQPVGDSSSYRRAKAMRTSVYTESAARSVKEVLKSSEDMDEFYQAVCSVYSWLETGECTKRSSDTFLHMLQLMSGRASAFKEFDEDRSRTRELEDLEWHGSMAHQCEGLRRTFEVANKQKVRDILSKPQRKNLDSWTNTVVEAAERFRKLFAAEANMDDDGDNMDTEPIAPPPPPPAPVPVAGTKRTADAAALAEAEAKISEQEEALKTARSRVNFLEQELKSRSVNETSVESRVRSFEEEVANLKQQLKQQNGASTQKMNNLEAKLAATQKKFTTMQEKLKAKEDEWEEERKEWETKEDEWKKKEREYKRKEKEREEQEKERQVQEKLEKEKREKAEKERLEQEKEREEKEKLEKEKREREEKEKLEKEKQEREEKEKLEKEKQEREEKEKLEKEKQEREEKEKQEKERQEQLEKEQQEKLKVEKLATEKMEEEKAEEEQQEKECEEEKQEGAEEEMKEAEESEKPEANEEAREQEDKEEQEKEEPVDNAVVETAAPVEDAANGHTDVEITDAAEDAAQNVAVDAASGEAAMEVDAGKQDKQSQGTQQNGVLSQGAVAPAPVSALHACAAACIAVYLSSHPNGTSLSDLAVYLTKLSGSSGDYKMVSLGAATKVVQETLNTTPGVFQSNLLAGESLWSLVAFRSLQRLLATVHDS